MRITVGGRVAGLALAAFAVAPAAPRASEAPKLTPAEERALADDLLFCSKLMGTLAQVRGQSEDQKKLFEGHGLLFMQMAQTLIPEAELTERIDATGARFRPWVDKAAEDVDEFRRTLKQCVEKRDANSPWITERRKAARAAADAKADAKTDAKAEAKAEEADVTFEYGGLTWAHRWSRAGQHEFTPSGQPDLDRWTRMVTLNVHDQVSDGEGLAKVANAVVENYKRAGKVLRTSSKPATAAAPAQHFASAILGAPGTAEVVFARFLLRDGSGLVVVASRRFYGAKAGDEATAWLADHAAEEEASLMSWDGLPSLGSLRSMGDAAR